MSLYHEHIRSCSDGNCIWKRPEGMHTNGGCRCTRDMQWMSEHYEALTVEERQQLKKDWAALRANIAIMRDHIEELESHND